MRRKKPERNEEEMSAEVTRAEAEHAADEQEGRWPEVHALAEYIRRMRENSTFVADVGDAMRRRGGR